MPDETPKDLGYLSLQEFARTVKERGVELSYSQISKWINYGDIAELLQIEGGKNGRKVPPAAVEILVAFWPEYQRGRFELPQAPAALRAFLNSRRVEPGQTLTVTSAGREIARTDEPPPSAPVVGGFDARQAVLQGAASQLPLYLTASEAAKVWRVSVKKFRDQGPKPTLRVGDGARNERWLLSDLLPQSGGNGSGK